MYIHVKAHPNAKKQKIEQRKKYYFDIFCKEKAERNKVNNCIIRILASFFSVQENSIKIISGHKERKKLLFIKEKQTGSNPEYLQ